MEVDYGPVIADLKRRLELVNRVIESAEGLQEPMEDRKEIVAPPAAGAPIPRPDPTGFPHAYTVNPKGYDLRCWRCGLPEDHAIIHASETLLAQRMVVHPYFGGFGPRLDDNCVLCGLPEADRVHAVSQVSSTDNKESPDSRRRETEEN